MRLNFSSDLEEAKMRVSSNTERTVFLRRMEFLEIDSEAAKTKKTSFVAKCRRKSGKGLLLRSFIEQFPVRNEISHELEKFSVGFRRDPIIGFHFSLQRLTWR